MKYLLSLLLLTALAARSQDSLVYHVVRDSMFIVNVFQEDLRRAAFDYAIAKAPHITETSFLEVLRDSLDQVVQEAIPAHRITAIKKGQFLFIEFICNGKGEIIQLRFMVRGDVGLQPKDFLLLDERLKAHKVAAVAERYKDFEMLPAMNVLLFRRKEY